MNRRGEHFCDSLVGRVARSGKLDEDVLVEAVRDAFLVPHERKAAIRKARLLLRKPNIRDRIAHVYEARGFNLGEAVDLHIKHIKGDADPRLPPSYSALKDFLTMVLPKEPKTLNVNSRSVNVNVNADPESNTPPPMEARVLSAHVE